MTELERRADSIRLKAWSAYWSAFLPEANAACVPAWADENALERAGWIEIAEAPDAKVEEVIRACEKLGRLKRKDAENARQSEGDSA